MFVLLLRHIYMYIYCHISLIKNFFLALAKKNNFAFFFQMKHHADCKLPPVCIYMTTTAKRNIFIN